VRHEIQRTLVPRATSLKDSGDPEALQAFGQDVIALARSRGVEELVDYARQLLAAIEGFDLDRVQYLLGLLADDSVLP